MRLAIAIMLSSYAITAASHETYKGGAWVIDLSPPGFDLNKELNGPQSFTGLSNKPNSECKIKDGSVACQPKAKIYMPPPQMNLSPLPSDYSAVYAPPPNHQTSQTYPQDTAYSRPVEIHVTQSPQFSTFQGMSSNGTIYSGSIIPHGGFTNVQGIDSRGSVFSKTCGPAGCF